MSVRGLFQAVRGSPGRFKSSRVLKNMANLPSKSKLSQRTQYFLIVFAATFLLFFICGKLGIGYSRLHPGILHEPLSTGTAALRALAIALVVAFFIAKKKSG
jgi:hypothetical protein